MYRRMFLIFAVTGIAQHTIATADEPEGRAETKQVLLLGQSPDGHPPTTHEYMAGMKVLAECLKDVGKLKPVVIKADDPWIEGPDLLEDADCVVLFVSQGAKWIQDDPRRFQAFTKLAQRGGGLVVLHWGMGARDAQYIQGFVNLFGGCHGGPDRKYKVLERAEVNLADGNHPVLRGLQPFAVREEFYYRLKFVKTESKLQPLLQVPIDGEVETVCWAWERPEGGRSFGFSGGHFHANWQRPEYRRLMAHAVLWTAGVTIPESGLPVDVPASVLKLE